MVLVFALFLSLPYAAGFEKNEKQSTAYEGQLSFCGEYGYCRKQVSHDEAIIALEKHYSKKNMTVQVINKEDRFIEADIYKGKDLVDRIVLDCKTGKIRSRY